MYSGSTLIINNAKADNSTKGIATFTSTNFQDSLGLIDTIQGISTSATPQFASLILSGASSSSVSIQGFSVVGTTNQGIKLNNNPLANTSALLQLGTSSFSGNSNGTYLGINQTASSDFLDFQTGGTQELTVSSTGHLIALGGIESGKASNTEGTLILDSSGISNVTLAASTSNSSASAYTFTFPNNPGSVAGQCLTSDSHGNTSWSSCVGGAPGNPGAAAILNSDPIGNPPGNSLQTDAAFYIQSAFYTTGNVIEEGALTPTAPLFAPTVTPTNGTGSTTYSYVITAVNSQNISSLASPIGTTAIGVATLNSTTFNQITWGSVTGAVTYNIYRMVGGTSQGLIGNVSAAGTLVFNDTGVSTIGGNPPSAADALQFKDNLGSNSGGFCPSGSALQLNYDTGCSFAINIGGTGGITPGINFADDTQLYRSSKDALTIQGSDLGTVTLQSASSPIAGENLVIAAGAGSGSNKGGSIQFDVSIPNYASANAQLVDECNIFGGNPCATSQPASALASDPTPTNGKYFIYWQDNTTNANATKCIDRAQVDSIHSTIIAGSAKQCYVQASNQVAAIASDGNFIYFASNTPTAMQISRATITTDGSNPVITASFISNSSLNSACGFSAGHSHNIQNLDFANGYILWADTGADNTGNSNCIGAGKISNQVATNFANSTQLTPSCNGVPTKAVIQGMAINSTLSDMFWYYNPCGSGSRVLGYAGVSNTGTAVNFNANQNIINIPNVGTAGMAAGGFGSTDYIFLPIRSGAANSDNIGEATFTNNGGVLTPGPSSNNLLPSGKLSLFTSVWMSYSSGTSYLYYLDGVNNGSSPNYIGRITPIAGAPNAEVPVLSIDNNNGGVQLTSAQDNTSAFTVQTKSGSNIMNIDTLNNNVSIAGTFNSSGGANFTGLGTPSAPTITPTCVSSCSNSYSYAITAVSNLGNQYQTPLSPTTSGSNNATLSTTNFNTIAWAPVSGASQYYVYRCSGTGYPTGVIATYTAATYVDVSLGNTFLGNSPSVTDTGQGTITIPNVTTSIACNSSSLTQNLSGTLLGSGPVLFKNSTNSTNAFQVQNAAGSTNILDVDTINSRIGIGTSSPQASLDVRQISNGNDAFIIRRATDTSPTGNFLRLQNAAGADLVTVDISGNLTVKNAVVNGTLTVNGHIITGDTSLGSITNTPGDIGTGGSGCTITNGNQSSATITVNYGSSGRNPGISCTIAITGFTSAPRPIISGTDQASSGIQPFVSATTGLLTIGISGNPGSGATYTFDIFNIQ